MKRLSYVLFIAVLFFTAGCTPRGYIYTHITEPLDINMSESVNQDMRRAGGNVKHFTYNIVRVRWGSRGIGDVAKSAGIEKVYYADLETLSVLGVWNQYFVHVYGK